MIAVETNLISLIFTGHTYLYKGVLNPQFLSFFETNLHFKMVKQVPLPSASRNRRSNPNTSPPEEPARFAFQKQRRDSQSSLNYNYGGIPSSDPPLFSSDDLPFSLENYREGASKRKRTYRGPWWGEEVEPKRKRKHLKKKAALDSGVWMRSDDDVAADNSSPADDASGTGAVNTGERRIYPRLCRRE